MRDNYTAIESDEAGTPQQATYGASSGGSRESGPSEWGFAKKLKESAHPVALLFFIIFRLGTIVVYVLGNLFIGIITHKNQFVLQFISIIILASADFWNIKNIAGRLLVGLRWWNEIQVKDASQGTFENVWVFETANPNRYINPIDSNVFWSLLYGQPAVWIVLGIFALLKLLFLYLLLILICICLSLTNAVAFTRCDKFGKANSLATGIMARATGNILSRLNPFS